MRYDLDISIIDALCKIGIKHNIDKITLFGSRARGDNKRNSDIDLAIYINKDLDSRSLIYFDIDDIETLLKFDITFIEEDTDERLLSNIKRDGVVLYERK